jgi:putative tryptophan/tyrosine transport system substrate-binding protein
MAHVKRREFISLLGGATVVWPLAARAQQKPRVVGFLGANTPVAAGHMTSAFVTRLRDLGWIEGRNVVIEYRWAAGQTAKFRELAAELVAAGADVIVTSGNAPAIAARQATSSVPIVLASSADIMATGLVKSLARPGGNVTGLTVAADDTAGKRLELLREAVPGLNRIAVLFNPDAGRVEVSTLREVAPAVGVVLDVFEFRTTGDLDRIAAYPDRSVIGGLFVVSDPLVFTNRVAINAFAIREKLPSVHRLREYVDDGGLMSYGPDFRVFFPLRRRLR